MTKNNRSLSPSEAAQRLGVSTKTLRLYEDRSFISPTRTESGWRTYSPDDIDTAAQVVSLRRLGLSLAQVEQVLNGDFNCFADALLAHERDLTDKAAEIQATVAKVHELRHTVLNNELRSLDDLSKLIMPAPDVVASFDLPWPWDGEIFNVRPPGPLNFIVGPLASGKTRFAKRLADAIPDAAFVSVDRLANDCADAKATLAQDTALKSRVDIALNWLVGEGADLNDALLALIAGLEADTRQTLVIDYIEQDLPTCTQHALGSYLRKSSGNRRPLFVMTRSTAILDLEQVGPDEQIILCPPNQSTPMYVQSYVGAPGYETVTLCLATPEIRQRMDGVVAIRRTVTG